MNPYHPRDLIENLYFTKQFSQLMNFRGPKTGNLPASDGYPKGFSHSEDSCRNELHPHVGLPARSCFAPPPGLYLASSC